MGEQLPNDIGPILAPPLSPLGFMDHKQDKAISFNNLMWDKNALSHTVPSKLWEIGFVPFQLE